MAAFIELILDMKLSLDMTITAIKATTGESVAHFNWKDVSSFVFRSTGNQGQGTGSGASGQALRGALGLGLEWELCRCTPSTVWPRLASLVADAVGMIP